ncbi:hypothetical protein DFH07DRAFT_785389 [Mycena maculata]|uniref:Uncharacterized protein n=1 Tax=Mycena maculata TaxID=230809 RepID=A0AAD7HBC7_9AGAR|nr:hypothetical protein DFH07DRAFT_785389 [Mycena maculata]
MRGQKLHNPEKRESHQPQGWHQAPGSVQSSPDKGGRLATGSKSSILSSRAANIRFELFCESEMKLEEKATRRRRAARCGGGASEQIEEMYRPRLVGHGKRERVASIGQFVREHIVHRKLLRPHNTTHIPTPNSAAHLAHHSDAHQPVLRDGTSVLLPGHPRENQLAHSEVVERTTKRTILRAALVNVESRVGGERRNPGARNPAVRDWGRASATGSCLRAIWRRTPSASDSQAGSTIVHTACSESRQVKIGVWTAHETRQRKTIWWQDSRKLECST